MNKIPVYRESVGNHCDNEIRPVKIVIPALAVPVAAALIRVTGQLINLDLFRFNTTL